MDVVVVGFDAPTEFGVTWKAALGAINACVWPPIAGADACGAADAIATGTLAAAVTWTDCCGNFDVAFVAGAASPALAFSMGEVAINVDGGTAANVAGPTPFTKGCCCCCCGCASSVLCALSAIVLVLVVAAVVVVEVLLALLVLAFITDFL